MIARMFAAGMIDCVRVCIVIAFHCAGENCKPGRALWQWAQYTGHSLASFYEEVPLFG